MQKMIQNNNGFMRIIIRLCALIILLCFVIILITSGLYVSAHTEHEHGHDSDALDDCMVCLYIHKAKELPGQIGAAINRQSSALTCLLQALAIVSAILVFSNYNTLVKLKTKMND